MKVLFRSYAIKNLLFGYSEHTLTQFAVFDELLSNREGVRVGPGCSDIFIKIFISSFLFIFIPFIPKVLTNIDRCDVFHMLLRIAMNPSLIRFAIFLIIHYAFNIVQVSRVLNGQEMLDLVHTEHFQPALTFHYHSRISFWCSISTIVY